MSDNKKYYYLKLKENFFEQDAAIVLESMPDGYLYENILLKLYLRSLHSEGRLMFNDEIPYNSAMLAAITRHPVGVVEKAVDILERMKLITVLDNGAMYMNDIQNFIGKSSTTGDRLRNYRTRINDEKLALKDGEKDVQMNTNLDVQTNTRDRDRDRVRDRVRDRDREKKEKPPRHRYGEYTNVLLTDQDMEKLKTEFPSDWEQRIERLSSYMASTGKSYKNHLATIRNWARMDKEKVARKQAEETKHFAGNDDPERIKQDEEMREFIKKMGWD